MFSVGNALLVVGLRTVPPCSWKHAHFTTGLPPLPTRGRWNQTPWALNSSTAVFFVGNDERMETEAEYVNDARWGILGYSWDVNNKAANDSHAEQWELEEAKAVRKYNPTQKIMVTREVSVIGQWYDAIDVFDPANFSFWIHCNGKEEEGAGSKPCDSAWVDNYKHTRTTGRWLNFSNPKAADWYVDEYCGAALRRPEIDGIYFDSGPGLPKNAVVPSDAECGRLSADAQRTFDRVLQLAAKLGKWVTTQGAVAGASTVAPWQWTGSDPSMCTSGGLGGCKGRAPITAPACAAAVRRVIAAANESAVAGRGFQLWTMGGQWPDFHRPPGATNPGLDNVTANPAAFAATVSLFQLARTPSSVLQWQTWSFTETRLFPWVHEVMEAADYGPPAAAAAAGAGPAVAVEVAEGVFERAYEKKVARLNCSAFVEALEQQKQQQQGQQQRRGSRKTTVISGA